MRCRDAAVDTAWVAGHKQRLGEAVRSTWRTGVGHLPGVADVAGCMLGIVPEGRLFDGGAVRPGDAVLELAAAGPRTNGCSLARAVLGRSGLTLDGPLPGGAASRAISCACCQAAAGPACASRCGSGRPRSSGWERPAKSPRAKPGPP
jgi:hypothetical protein